MQQIVLSYRIVWPGFILGTLDQINMPELLGVCHVCMLCHINNLYRRDTSWQTVFPDHEQLKSAQNVPGL